MKNKGLEISNLKISNRKLRGEWAEMRFMVRAAEEGLQICKPWGEMTRFDFVVCHGPRLLRVQVKSTTVQQDGGYICTVRGKNRPYEADAFEFLAAYVVAEDVWYILPAKKVHGRGSIRLNPHKETHSSARYKEAWHLLRKKSRPVKGVIPLIEACAASFEPALFEEPSGLRCSQLEDFR
jgi:hypothetical protein